MNRITICIPTYKRPEMLKNLVVSINECNIDQSLIGRVNIVIVDNDTGKSAYSTVQDLIGSAYKFEISYFCYPVKGLANVRNAMIEKGLEHNPDFLVFVDDDEFVSGQWLNQLVKTIEANNGDLAMGPVNSVVNEKVPGYVSCWLDRDEYLNNTKLGFIRSGNLIIRTRSLLKYDVRFDPRFNKTGGEDSYFGLQMIKKGATIFWASEAVAYETVPDSRANIRWILRRYYNGANKYAYILKIEKDRMQIIRKFLVSCSYIFMGLVLSIITLFPVRKRYWAILKLAEGFGGLAGFLSLRYAAYN